MARPVQKFTNEKSSPCQIGTLRLFGCAARDKQLSASWKNDKSFTTPARCQRWRRGDKKLRWWQPSAVWPWDGRKRPKRSKQPSGRWSRRSGQTVHVMLWDAFNFFKSTLRHWSIACVSGRWSTSSLLWFCQKCANEKWLTVLLMEWHSPITYCTRVLFARCRCGYTKYYAVGFHNRWALSDNIDVTVTMWIFSIGIAPAADSDPRAQWPWHWLQVTSVDRERLGQDQGQTTFRPCPFSSEEEKFNPACKCLPY